MGGMHNLRYRVPIDLRSMQKLPVLSICIVAGFVLSELFLTPTNFVFFFSLQKALDKAKEAGRKERALCRQREQATHHDQINLDLTYSVSTVLC